MGLYLLGNTMIGVAEISLLTEGTSAGVIGLAVIAAWRLTKRAHTDAIEIYKQASADATMRLDSERDAWADEKASLIRRIAELEGRDMEAYDRRRRAETETNQEKETNQ